MKNGGAAVFSVLLIGFSVCSLTIYDNYYSKHNISKWLSTSPIFYLTKAEVELEKARYYNSKVHLEKAIFCMTSIESYATSEVNVYMERSIEKLQDIVIQLDQRNVSKKEMKKAYFHAINTVAYAELNISEKKYNIGEFEQSLLLMKTVRNLLNNSLEYTNPAQHANEEELNIINHLTTLIGGIERRKIFNEEDYIQIKSELEVLLEAL